MIDKRYQDFFIANKKAWNKKTPFHFESDFYNVEGVLNGGLSLYNIELNELKDLENKNILHLQCHFGLDSFSFERLGSNVTGVDFSETSIDLANSIKNQLNSKVNFICANIYDLNKISLDKEYDIIYSSYGALTWLPDLNEWAKLIFKYLKTGGVFYIVDFHPLLICYNNLENKIITNSYFNNDVIFKTHKGTYTNFDADIETKEYTWNHPISEVLNSFIKLGFKIDFFNEYPFVPFNCFPNLVFDEKDNNWKLKENPDIPLTFSLKIIK
jgi:SAM-dependent methyltransferase